MRNFKYLAVTVLFLLGACSSSPSVSTDYSSDYDFNTVKSFHVVGDDQYKNPYLSDINRDRINQSIENELREDYLVERSETDADILVTYFVVTKDKVKVTSTPSTSYYSRYGSVLASDVSARSYVEGTLIIDVIDADSNKSVWRSEAVKSIKNYDSAKERDKEISKMIDAMFDHFLIEDKNV